MTNNGYPTDSKMATMDVEPHLRDADINVETQADSIDGAMWVMIHTKFLETRFEIALGRDATEELIEDLQAAVDQIDDRFGGGGE